MATWIAVSSSCFNPLQSTSIIFTHLLLGTTSWLSTKYFCRFVNILFALPSSCDKSTWSTVQYHPSHGVNINMTTINTCSVEAMSSSREPILPRKISNTPLQRQLSCFLILLLSCSVHFKFSRSCVRPGWHGADRRSNTWFFNCRLEVNLFTFLRFLTCF